jgi:hypothetical protein
LTLKSAPDGLGSLRRIRRLKHKLNSVRHTQMLTRVPTRPIQHQQNSLGTSRLVRLEHSRSTIIQHSLKRFRVQHRQQIPDASPRFWMHESHDINPLEPMIDFDNRLSSTRSVHPSDDRFQPDTVFLLTRQHLTGCSRFITGPEFNVINNCLSRFDGFWECLFLKSSTSAGFDFSCVGRGTCKVNRIIANNL